MDRPTKEQKIAACSRYNSEEFKNREWTWVAPLPDTCNHNWDAESWVKWVDAHGSWKRRITKVTLHLEDGRTLEVTGEQEEALQRLKKRWDKVSEPRPMPCDDCVLVTVGSECGGVSMILGIETDGHTHS